MLGVTGLFSPAELGFGRLLSTISEAVVVAEVATGRVVLWNRAAEDLFGYSAAEALALPVEALVPDRFKARFRAAFARYRKTGRGRLIQAGRPLELPALRKDGAERTVELRLNPIEDAPVGGRFVLALAHDLTERRRAEEERARLYRALAVRERQLQDLVRRLLVAQEEERRRLAYELHDGVAQTAAGVHLHLRAFARRYREHLPAAREELDGALALAQRVVREARTVVGELRPTVLDDLGLEAALRAEVEELKKEGWQVDFEAELGPERLHPAVETALFRVAQEALRNARKHAGATRARVAVRRTQRSVRLEVRDWGRGFDPAALPVAGGPGERVGLSGMQERCAVLGGRCKVRSRSGDGTRIVAVVPLRPAPGPVEAARAGSQ